jgi:hypothetical protein
MGIPRNLALAYIGLQASKGSAASAPFVAFPVTGGKVFNHDITQDLVELTGTSPGRGAADRTMIVPGASLPTLAFTKSIGQSLYAALGGYAVTGSGPYAHVFTAAVEPLPWHTLWGRYGSDYVRILNAKCDTLTIAFDGAGLATVEQTWMGTTSLWADTPSAATHDDTGPAPTALRAGGGTFQLDVDGTSLATYCIRSGSVAISRNMTPDTCAASITPDDHTSGIVDVTWSLTIVPASTLVDVRNVVTGTPAGTAPSSAPVYGAASITLTDGTSTLVLASNRIDYLTETPDADPAGGTTELVLEGRALAIAGGQQLTATLTNTVPDFTP